MGEDRIISVEPHDHVLALAEPLRIGPMSVTERRFASVRVLTEHGRTGVAVAQTRGAPVAAIVSALLAPAVVGRDATAVAARWEEMFRATIAVGRVGLVVRAISLVDIALWDLLGQEAGLPVARILGGFRERIPVTFIAGLAGGPDDVAGVVDAAVEAATAGHATIKIARPPTAELALALITKLDRALPPGTRLIVDANWIWRSVPEALRELATWPVRRLEWVEDPFPPEQTKALRALRRATDIPVAAGDEVADPGLVHRLLDGAVDVLRLDVLTVGGITAAIPLVGAAHREAVPVSFHISPETSVHVACGLPGARDIETFDRTGNRFDPSHELLSGGPTFTSGTATLTDRPGLGFVVTAPD